MDLTRKYTFSASHRLHSDAFSEAENTELFGKCNNPYGHGHDYEIFVTARGAVDGETGQVCSPAVLDALVKRHVLDAFEHRNMNTDVAEFVGLVPTTENLASVIAERLRVHWAETFPAGQPKLQKVRIRETDRNSFELIL